MLTGGGGTQVGDGRPQLRDIHISMSSIKAGSSSTLKPSWFSSNWTIENTAHVDAHDEDEMRDGSRPDEKGGGSPSSPARFLSHMVNSLGIPLLSQHPEPS